VIDSGPSGSPENADVLPSRRALRAQREAAEAAAESASAAIVPDSLEPSDAATASNPDVAAASTVEVTASGTDIATSVLDVATTRVLDVIVSAEVPAPVAPVAPDAAVSAKPSALKAQPQVAIARPHGRRSATHASPSKASSSTAPSSKAPAAKASPSTSPRRRARSRSPITVLVAIMAIPGLFLTAGLPAYAFDPQAAPAAGISAHAQLEADAQDVVVAATAAHTVVSRDGFSASTAEELAERSAELRREGAAAAARASAAEFATSGIRAEGDDYPWPFEATDDEGGGLSPLGYYYRECVDFVAWRLNRDAGSGSSPWQWTWSKMTPGNGNASGWADAWASHGWATSATPVVGAVAWFNYNHVAYVQSIPGDGTVVLEEYNWMGSHAYHTRTVSIGDVPLYLYPPS